ncbi:4-hydroxy-2-oxoheptanedioate aldolase [Deinococcus fonticola]|uniref:4-hydroxy-2-oxoheptanedioate aldolase n=1 Tax=Deinococcus fonticola TaxID=2528713 RepID=UPI001074B9D6|nr:4-hydroxy-2-oxoheptanedioate aldolase [Deinococcus fonticola]
MNGLINEFKVALQSRQPQIGLWLGLADPYCAEICAGAGFDWLLIDGEHAPNDVRSTLSILQTLAAYPVAPVVRPPVVQTHLIKQYLDLGVQTLLLPMIDTAEQAQAAVTATRYPPQGVRGVGSALARASRWNSIPDYLHRADSEICVLVQAETREALKNLDSILAVEGVDGVFIGPADLSGSLGHLGNPGHPEVVTAIEDTIGRIVGAGKAAGILSSDVNQAKRYLELGATFVAVGVDTSLLAQASRNLARQFTADRQGETQGDGTY